MKPVIVLFLLRSKNDAPLTPATNRTVSGSFILFGEVNLVRSVAGHWKPAAVDAGPKVKDARTLLDSLPGQ